MNNFQNLEIEKIILKYSKRGMNILKSYIDKEFCKKAIEELFLCNRGTIFIITGFVKNGFAETDGPIGAFFLAKALKKINFNPIIITDEFCRNFFNFKENLKVIYLNNDYHLLMNEVSEILLKYNPVSIVSIERCGRTKNNRYYNMKGEEISKFTLPLDELFLQCNEDVLKIGIGDGGNEIGMGNLRTIIEEKLNIIPSIIEVHHLIISTTSNWGAYGLIAYMEYYTNIKLMPDYDEIYEYLEFIIELGAVDGTTGKSTKTVDGFNSKIEMEIIENLKYNLTQCSS
ncbi:MULTISPECIES: DUF4392 domain-containing protein [unclassified Clostridium]|uniref:DUF4392 domain-containing protein n=1 Tax=unclassified Clostridium TaxID=2614128 RepID=UPI0025BF60CD|nr:MULTISPECIES: DUF4392 domain-containing protein [unclassified Clostridium]